MASDSSKRNMDSHDVNVQPKGAESLSTAPYERVRAALRQHPKTWLVTGVGGFIGSNLLEALLQLDQRVIGVDNFATGHRANLDEVRSLVGAQQWARFTFLEGDILDPNVCRHACEGVDTVLHQAALGSVPRSIEDPRATHAANVTGFLEMLVAARDARVRRFVYAASSSTYGDDAALTKSEATIGRPLSPYAVSKYVNELYADVFGRCYGLETIGLRYFNVFGPRQDPDGPYAAVIPRWIAAMVLGEPVCVNGDGEQTRDFCYVEDVVQANLLAATTEGADAIHQVYNVAVGNRTTLNQLLQCLRAALADQRIEPPPAPVYGPERAGDVRHSQADVAKAIRLLGYQPAFVVDAGIRKAMPWYVRNLRSGTLAAAGPTFTHA